ncbi:MAG: hypothetical protein ABW046_15075 [Actinoplanes sp.]
MCDNLNAAGATECAWCETTLPEPLPRPVSAVYVGASRRRSEAAFDVRTAAVLVVLLVVLVAAQAFAR